MTKDELTGTPEAQVEYGALVVRIIEAREKVRTTRIAYDEAQSELTAAQSELKNIVGIISDAPEFDM